MSDALDVIAPKPSRYEAEKYQVADRHWRVQMRHDGKMLDAFGLNATTDGEMKDLAGWIVSELRQAYELGFADGKESRS
jgi:hypothetical protein